MLDIVWTDDAIGHLEGIFTYVEVFDPAAAARLAKRLVDVAESLADFPNRGRETGDGYREMTIVPPYILRYRVEEGRVLIIRIRHGARDEEAS